MSEPYTKHTSEQESCVNPVEPVDIMKHIAIKHMTISELRLHKENKKYDPA